MKIFLVDDSPQVVECLKEMFTPLIRLEVAGYATDLPDALCSIRKTPPDVVILDLHLPSGSGMQVLKAIKKELPAVAVIVLTNYAFPQYKQKCMALGAYAFLDKSKDFTRVPQLLRALADAEVQEGASEPPLEALAEPAKAATP